MLESSFRYLHSCFPCEIRRKEAIDLKKQTENVLQLPLQICELILLNTNPVDESADMSAGGNVRLFLTKLNREESVPQV